MSGIFTKLAGIDLTFIPHRSALEAINDLVADRTQMQFSPVAQISPQIALGKVQALAMTGEHRLDELRDVPTLKESGFDNFPSGTWSGVLASTSTPDNIVDRLNAAINQVLAGNEFRSKVQRMGGLVSRGSAKDFTRSIQQQSQLWSDLIRLCPECTDVNCTSPRKPCSYDSSVCCSPK
jgi:tripartite-type tricarboxylate transporter receptor subunit TctC